MYEIIYYLVINLAHCIIFEKTLKVNGKRLFMMHHRQHGDYNKETSIYISQLNPRCKEEDIIEELNLVLRDHRVTRDKTLNKAQ